MRPDIMCSTDWIFVAPLAVACAAVVALLATSYLGGGVDDY